MGALDTLDPCRSPYSSLHLRPHSGVQGLPLRRQWSNRGTAGREKGTRAAGRARQGRLRCSVWLSGATRWAQGAQQPLRLNISAGLWVPWYPSVSALSLSASVCLYFSVFHSLSLFSVRCCLFFLLSVSFCLSTALFLLYLSISLSPSLSHSSPHFFIYN